MSERLSYMGRLREKELEQRRLVLKAEGLRDSIRTILDPFEKIEIIRADVAAEQAMELAMLSIRIVELNGEIAAIKRALGKE